MTRIIVSGSRNWDRPDVVIGELDLFAEQALRLPERELTVVHGSAYPPLRNGVRPLESADWLAHLWCGPLADHWRNAGLSIVEEPWPADWPTCAESCPTSPKHRRLNKRGEWYCPTAGLRRNTDMGVRGADWLLALWRDQSSGTKYMIGEARRIGIPPRIIDYADVAGLAVPQ